MVKFLKKKNSLVLQRILKNLLCDGISESSEVFYDIHCSDPCESNKDYFFPAVVLNEHGVFPFVLYDESSEVAFEQAETFEYIVSVFKTYFCVRHSIETLFVLQPSDDLCRNFDVFVFDSEAREYVNNFPRNDCFKKISFDDVVGLINGGLRASSEPACLDEGELDELSLKLFKECSDALESDFVSSNYFVKKGDHWKPAFKQDPEKVFKLALFGGFLGLHRFYLKMFGTGLLYALTFGYLGVGWFFDCLEIILGRWCKNEKYLMPLNTGLKHIVQMTCVFGFVLLLVLLLFSAF